MFIKFTSSFSCILLLLIFSFSITHQGELQAAPVLTQDETETDEADESGQEDPQEKPADPVEAPASDPIDIELPDDPTAVVLTYHIENQFRPTTDVDFEPSTLLKVLANGKVLVGRNDPRGTELEYMITEEEVRALLDEVINKYKILEITTDNIKKRIKDTGRPFFLMNAPRHQIKISIPDHQHDVEIEALVSIRNFYSEIEQIQTFAKLERIFKVMRARGAIGDQGQVDKLQKAMDKQFKEQYPDHEPLTIEDVDSAFVDKKGRLQSKFTRVDDDGTRAFAYSCAVVRSKKGKISVDLKRAGLPSSKKKTPEESDSDQ